MVYAEPNGDISTEDAGYNSGYVKLSDNPRLLEKSLAAFIGYQPRKTEKKVDRVKEHKQQTESDIQ